MDSLAASAIFGEDPIHTREGVRRGAARFLHDLARKISVRTRYDNRRGSGERKPVPWASHELIGVRETETKTAAAVDDLNNDLRRCASDRRRSASNASDLRLVRTLREFPRNGRAILCKSHKVDRPLGRLEDKGYDVLRRVNRESVGCRLAPLITGYLDPVAWSGERAVECPEQAAKRGPGAGDDVARCVDGHRRKLCRSGTRA